MTMYDLNRQKTVFEKMRNKQLPKEYYPRMYQDGYSPYDIIETVGNSIIEENYRRKEAQLADEKPEAPMSIKLISEVRTK